MTRRRGDGAGDPAIRAGKGQCLRFAGAGPPPRRAGGGSLQQGAGKGGKGDPEMGVGVFHRGERRPDADFDAQLVPDNPFEALFPRFPGIQYPSAREGGAGFRCTIRGASGGAASDRGKSVLPSNSNVLEKCSSHPCRAYPRSDGRHGQSETVSGPFLQRTENDFKKC